MKEAFLLTEDEIVSFYPQNIPNDLLNVKVLVTVTEEEFNQRVKNDVEWFNRNSDK